MRHVPTHLRAVSGRRRNARRLPLHWLLAAMVVVLAPTVVFAWSTYLSTWQTRYPSSTSDNASCDLCHGTSTSNWNAYGSAIKAEWDTNGNNIAAAIAAVEAADSDSDPTASSNLKEINANTQPGWTYGNNNTIYDDTGTPISTNRPPEVSGKIDPATLVQVSDNAFTPGTVAPKLGTGVFWTRATGSVGNHNVAEVGDIFRSGAATTGAIDFLVTFSAGTFNYECEVHPTMTGIIKVKPKVGAAPTGLPFTVTWATSKTDSGTQFDVQYKIGTGSWKNWKTDTTAFKAVFGKDGSPVTVVAGRKYSFRAASQSGAATSSWSPTTSFTP